MGKPFGVRELLEFVQTSLLGPRFAAHAAKPDPMAHPSMGCRAA
jgi:hypothetical protein